ncbi:MAG: high-potential iron-sulfur protein [Steroidobacteraceae bacterium]
MKIKYTRRGIIKDSLMACALAPVAGLFAARSGWAASLTPLSPSDPAAAALGFVADARKVVAASNPTFAPTQNCGSCAQYQGKASDPTAGCNIFPGKSVPAGGWCKVWAKKSGG